MSEQILLEEEKNQEMNDKNKYDLADYEFGKTLGKGTFGKVKEAIHLPTQQKVAIKIIDKQTIKDEDDRERVNRQVEIMRVLRHPNIIQLYQIIETSEYIFLVTQYAEQGELFRLMSEEVRLSEKAAGRIFIQLMNAVGYMHRLGIAHRDLKPENILLDVDYNIKLIDFGLSNYVESGKLLSTACGSPCYAPPEMVSGKNYDGKIGDVWSMGIIFYGMICGSLPFEQKTTKDLYKKVIDGFYVIPCDITMEAIEVIRSMLVTEPQKRITIPQLRNLPFFDKLKEIQPDIIGIIVGFHPMPIDNEILIKMKEFLPFQRQKAEDQLKENYQNKLTTTYYLLQKKSLREGGKTIVDLQVFLETHDKYKDQYGKLPTNFESTEKQIKTDRVTTGKESHYKMHHRKGLSQQKRPPLSLSKRNPDPKLKIRIPQRTFSNEKLRKNNIQRSLDAKGKTLRLKTSLDKSQQRSVSERKRKSLNKRKKNNQELALDLWHAYFQKPFQNTVKSSNKKALTHRIKPSQQQKTKIFNDKFQKLKEGFLRLPQMNKREIRMTSRKKETKKQVEIVKTKI